MILPPNIISIPIPLPPYYRRSETAIGWGPDRRGPTIEIRLWFVTLHYNMIIMRDGGHTFGHVFNVHRSRGWRFGFWWDPWVRIIRAPGDRVTAIWSTSTHAYALDLQEENARLKTELTAAWMDLDMLQMRANYDAVDHD